MIRKIILAVLLSSLATYVLPEIHARQTIDSNYLSFRHITTEEGLSHFNIQTVCEDKDGNILIGTRYGINKYNGHSFKYYFDNKADSLSLNGGNITSLYRDSNDRIWAGTIDGGVNLYNVSFDKFIPKTNGLSVTTILEDSDGQIWMAAEGNGLLIMDNDGITKSYSIKADHEESNVSISALCELDDRFLIVGTRMKGIYYFDRNKKDFTKILVGKGASPLSDKDILDIKIFDGKFFFATGEGVYQSSISEFKQSGLMNLHPFFPEVIGFSVDKLVVHKNGLWCATDNGLISFHINQDGRYSCSIYRHDHNDLNSLICDNVNDIFFDSSEIMWVATTMGLSYCPLRGVQFKNFVSPELDDVFQNVVFQDSKERIWVGLQNGKLCCYDNHSNQLDSYDIDCKKIGALDCIAEDPWGYLWVAKWTGGLYRIAAGKPGKLKMEEITVTDTHHITSLVFYCGCLFVGTFGEGISVFRFNADGALLSVEDLATFSKNKKIGLLSTRINYMYPDPIDNSLWISTPKGLNRLYYSADEYTLDSYTKNGDDGYLSDDFVWEVVRSSPEYLWVATIYDGLNKITFDPKTGKQKQLDVYRSTEGLPMNSIQTLDYDKMNDGIWIGSNKISYLDVKTGKINIFGSSDGVRGSFIRVNSSETLSDGAICFGTDKGLNIIKPSKMPRDVPPPSVQFESLVINGKESAVGDRLSPGYVINEPINECKRLCLSYDKKNIALQIYAVNYAGSDDNVIRYMLEGKNDNWMELKSSQINVNFDDLNHGNFTLKVQAANRNGMWSDSKTLDIEILRPMWLSWWAYSIYFTLIVSTAILIIHSIHQRQAIRHELLMERLKTEKQEELAMMKINFFTNISHDLLTPLTLIIDPLEHIVKKNRDDSLNYYFDVMHRNAEKLMSTIRQLLDFRKIETGNYGLRTENCDLVTLFKNVAYSFTYSVRLKNIKYQYSSNYEHYNTWIDKDCIERIIFNLLSNSLKYTEEGYIDAELEIISIQNCFQIIISDSGCGINDKDKEMIFESFFRSDYDYKRGAGIGLPLVKSLVELHYGKMEFSSKPGEGTSFIVTIPLGDSYMKREEKLIVPEEHSGETMIYAKADYGRNSILLAEDNAELLDYLVNELKNNYVVYSAKDGKDAYEKVVKYMPNLVVSDVMMPIIDGFKLCEKIKSRTSTKHIPIILLTAKISETDHNLGIEKGANAYIVKPFKLSTLKNYIRNLIHQANSMKLYYSAQKTTVENLEQNEFMAKVAQIMAAHIDDEAFFSKHFAMEMNMAYSTLYNKLKEFSGLSVTQYMRQYRLNEAARLLSNTTLTVNEVIYSVGFSDPKYFRECFKKQYGITPSEYIREYRNLQ